MGMTLGTWQASSRQDRFVVMFGGYNVTYSPARNHDDRMMRVRDAVRWVLTQDRVRNGVTYRSRWTQQTLQREHVTVTNQVQVVRGRYAGAVYAGEKYGLTVHDASERMPMSWGRW